MEYNQWYDNYRQNGGASAPHAVKQRRGVSVFALIACMLITALLGGAVGGYLMRITMIDRTAELSDMPQQQITAPAAAAADESESAPESEPAPTDLSSLLKQGAAGAMFTRAQIVEVGAPSVVGIDVEFPSQGNDLGGFEYFFGFGGGNGQPQTGSGSGVIITTDGYIVTCNHVVSGASRINVILSDETEHEATVVGTDPRNDLAVIKIETSGLTPATLGDSDMLTVGEDIVAIGNPLGELRGTSTGGMVSALGRQVTVEGTAMTLIQHDAAVSPGSSGGGLFNASGSLIGIVNAKASGNSAEGIGFAIPVNSVKQIISDLIEHGYVKGRAFLGVLTQNVTLRAEQGGWGGFFGYGGTSCVQVGQVVEGSAAEAAGIEVSDLILAVDDVRITSTDVFADVLNGYDAGDTATLTVQRSGRQLEIPVTFDEYAPEK